MLFFGAIGIFIVGVLIGNLNRRVDDRTMIERYTHSQWRIERTVNDKFIVSEYQKDICDDYYSWIVVKTCDSFFEAESFLVNKFVQSIEKLKQTVVELPRRMDS